MSGVYVYGPQGCGKTRNAQAIAKALGCKSWRDVTEPAPAVVKREPYRPEVSVSFDHYPELVLGNLSGMAPAGYRVMTFKQAMEKVKA